MSPLVEIDQEILVLPTFTLECGETLREVPVAYKTWGRLNEGRDNVMIICHAFTGSSDVEDWCVVVCESRVLSSCLIPPILSPRILPLDVLLHWSQLINNFRSFPLLS